MKNCFLLGDEELLGLHLQLLIERFQVGDDGFGVDVGDEDIGVFGGVLQHPAVQGHLPGVVVLQVAVPAHLRADIVLRLRKQLLGIDALGRGRSRRPDQTECQPDNRRLDE